MEKEQNQAKSTENGLYTLLPTVYSEHCPHCDSENITMIGDPEYNDEWECDDCKTIFNTFKTKVVNGG